MLSRLVIAFLPRSKHPLIKLGKINPRLNNDVFCVSHAWVIPWTEGAQQTQSMGSQRVGQSLVTIQQQLQHVGVTFLKTVFVLYSPLHHLNTVLIQNKH